MSFESLPNEILLNLFTYFDILPLFHAFHGLNVRFDTLLYNIYHRYHLNFQCISKQDFDTICEQYLPSIFDRIVSLHLSESDKTPGLPKLFLSRGFTLTQFIVLQSLTLYKLNYEYSGDFLSEIPHLKNLMYFNIIDCYIPESQESASYFWNQIWALPKLRHIQLESSYDSEIDFSRLTIISSSLESLSIKTTIEYSFNDMIDLFQYTPYLRILSIQIRCEKKDDIFSGVFRSLTTLKLAFYGAPRLLNNFFQNTPSLCCLTIEMRDCYLNGHEWKQILVDSLPKIKIFRFKMCIPSFPAGDLEEQVDEIVNTFRSPFWLDEHQWFVRCDWDPNKSSIFNTLYSLPYAFNTFTNISDGRSKWTSPDDRRQTWSFNRVRHLICNTSEEEHLNLHPIQFPKLHQLFISLPVNDQILFVIPTFNYLTSLSIVINGKNESDLQILFDRAPHLYELIIHDSYIHDLTVLSKLTSISIRRLEFAICDHDSHSPHYFNNENCMILSGSSLGQQCEILSGIRVTSFTSVVNFVNTMNNLRALTIHSKLQLLPPSTAIFIQWVRNQLPTTCLINSCSIYQDCVSISLWIS